MILFTNADNTIMHWNKTAEEKTNIEKEDALYHNLFDVLPRLNEEGFLVQLHSALKGNEGHSSRVSDAYFKALHNYWLWPLKNEEGEVLGVLHVIHDVSKQMELQQQLSERLNFIESLIESSIDRIVVLDRFMNYLYWNKKAEEYYAINKEKVLGRNILEVFPSFRNNPGYQQFRSVLKGETVYLPPVVQEETEEYFETYLIPVKDENYDVTAVLWIVHDLSREYRLTKERNRTSKLLQATLDASKEMVQVFEAVRNEEGEIVDFKWVLMNDEAQKWIGNANGESLLQHHPGVVEEGIFDTFKRVVETGIPDQSERHYVHEQFNNWFYQSTVKLNDGVATTTRDITQRKSAEQEILLLKDEIAQSATDKYHAILNSIDDAFAFCELVRDENGRAVHYRCLEFNQSFVKQTGWSAEEFVGRGATVQSGIDASWIEAYEKAVDTHTPVRFERFFANRWWDVGVYPFKENLFSVLFRDITGRKTVEEKIKNFNAELEQQITERMKELQKQLTLLRYTEYLAQSGSWEYEIETGNFHWSEGMYNMFGLPQQMKIDPEAYLHFAVEEDRSIAKKIVSHLKKKHLPFEEVMRIKRNNTERTIKIKASVLHDENKKPKKVIGVDVDVTDVRKAEEKLKESRHWLEQTTKTSPDSITIYDLENKQPAYLNNCLAEWIGIDSGELFEMGIEGRLQLIHPDDRLKLLHFNEKVAAANDSDVLTTEYRVVKDDSQWIWLRNRSRVFQRNASGKVTHLLSILQNVTEEIELREELKQRTNLAETILDSSTNRITAFDRNYRFIAWNRRCEQIHGMTREKVIGKTIFEIFPGVENYPVFMNAQEQSLKGEYVHVPFVQDGYTGAYLELFYVPLKNESGETYAVLNIMHDVTNYVKTTETLDALNKKLEAKNAELEQKNEEITSFAFITSHDMKEPLRKIHTFADWLMEQERNQLSPKGQSVVEKINASVHRMEILIDDILVLTKIHSDIHREEDVDLNRTLQQVMEDMSDSIHETKTTIHCGRLPAIKANSNQIFYLFKNLISNAIKFQRPGSIPQVTITSEIVYGTQLNIQEQKEEYLKLSFTDNGFGFDQRYAKKIFQVFQRLHGKHEYEGTGIGLAICKKIMENHNGIITVESELEKGSVFSCFFPLH